MGVQLRIVIRGHFRRLFRVRSHGKPSLDDLRRFHSLGVVFGGSYPSVGLGSDSCCEIFGCRAPHLVEVAQQRVEARGGRIAGQYGARGTPWSLQASHARDLASAPDLYEGMRALNVWILTVCDANI